MRLNTLCPFERCTQQSVRNDSRDAAISLANTSSCRLVRRKHPKIHVWVVLFKTSGLRTSLELSFYTNVARFLPRKRLAHPKNGHFLYRFPINPISLPRLYVCVCVCVDLASTGVQVVAVGGEEQMGEASMVTGGQQGQQGAVLAGVEAGAAGEGAAGVNRQAGAEAQAGDDPALALLLHCSRGGKGCTLAPPAGQNGFITEHFTELAPLMQNSSSSGCSLNISKTRTLLLHLSHFSDYSLLLLLKPLSMP